MVTGAFVISFILVILTIPSILRVAHVKKLFDPVDLRKIHRSNVPPLGGIAIFVSFILTTIVATDGCSFDSLKYIIAAVIIMFFIGLKDDLLSVSATNKLIVQLFAAILLITLGNIRFTSFHGILGIYEINNFTSIVFSIFVIVLIINAYNLIDGIDGLASGLTILSASVFGVWFYLEGNIQFSIMSFALVGSLSGFFIFNVFGKRNKLFMGDSGSLIIGLIISTLVIKFNETNIVKSLPYSAFGAPAVSLSIIIIPLIDTLRVMIVRIGKKRSPFCADRNHIHHHMLQMLPSHLKSTIFIVLINGVIIAISIILNYISLEVNLQFMAVLFIGIICVIIPGSLKHSPKTNYITNLKRIPLLRMFF